MITKLRLRSLLLSVLLQAAPLARLLSGDAVAAAAPLVAVIRWLALGAAACGGLDALSGATGTLLTQGGKSITSVNATNGVLLNGFRVQIQSDQFGIAPAYNFDGLPAGVTGSSQGVVLGTPQQTGVFTVSVTGFQFANKSGFTSSGGFTLSVQAGAPAVVITQGPAGQSVNPGSPVSFSVTATGPNLLYAWLKDGAVFPGASSSNLFIAAAQLSDAGRYAAVVSSGAASATSAPAVLTVIALAPHFAQAPAGVEVYAGEPAVLTASASGTPPFAYRWALGSQALPGQTNATLVLPAVEAANAGSYTVTVTGPGGAATSPPAVITLAAPLQVQAGPWSSPGAANLMFNAIPGRRYVVESRTELTAGVWSVGLTLAPAGPTVAVTNAVPFAPSLFFRVRALPAGP